MKVQFKAVQLKRSPYSSDFLGNAKTFVSVLVFPLLFQLHLNLPFENDDLPSVHLILLTLSVFSCSFYLNLLIEGIQPIQLK